MKLKLFRRRRGIVRDALLSLALLSLALRSLALSTLVWIAPLRASDDADWPCWRGPSRSGIASPDQKPPLRWSGSENIVWKAHVPGRGHGSPIVAGKLVAIQAADEKLETQSVLCFDRETGERLWEKELHRGGFAKLNKKASHASSTPAWDGERLIVNFLNDGAVWTTAVNARGKRLWRTRISGYVVHQGYGSSPFVHGELVLVTADNKSGGAICALRRDDGEIAWRVDRPRKPNYPSPVVLTAAGKEQLILTGCDLVSSFDPRSGRKLWEIPGATTECVTTSVTDGTHVYTSGGYPKNHVSAVRADGSGEIVWEKPVRVYVPSMILRDGFLFAVSDAGVAHCWKAASGEQMWKERLGGNFTSSPVLVGDHIYATNEKGTTFVYRASTEKLDVVARNQLGSQVYATPAVCGGRIFSRVASGAGKERREFLYCIGEE